MLHHVLLEYRLRYYIPVEATSEEAACAYVQKQIDKAIEEEGGPLVKHTSAMHDALDLSHYYNEEWVVSKDSE